MGGTEPARRGGRLGSRLGSRPPAFCARAFSFFCPEAPAGDGRHRRPGGRCAAQEIASPRPPRRSPSRIGRPRNGAAGPGCRARPSTPYEPTGGDGDLARCPPAAARAAGGARTRGRAVAPLLLQPPTAGGRGSGGGDSDSAKSLPRRMPWIPVAAARCKARCLESLPICLESLPILLAGHSLAYTWAGMAAPRRLRAGARIAGPGRRYHRCPGAIRVASPTLQT